MLTSIVYMKVGQSCWALFAEMINFYTSLSLANIVQPYWLVGVQLSFLETKRT